MYTVATRPSRAIPVLVWAGNDASRWRPRGAAWARRTTSRSSTRPPRRATDSRASRGSVVADQWTDAHASAVAQRWPDDCPPLRERRTHRARLSRQLLGRGKSDAAIRVEAARLISAGPAVALNRRRRRRRRAERGGAPARRLAVEARRRRPSAPNASVDRSVCSEIQRAARPHPSDSAKCASRIARTAS